MDKKMIDALPIGAALTTSDGRVLRVNPMGLELLGLTEDQIGTVKVPDLYVTPNKDRLDLWDTALQGGISRTRLMLWVNGEQVEFCVRSRLFGDNGHAVMVSAFWRKDTE